MMFCQKVVLSKGLASSTPPGASSTEEQDRPFDKQTFDKNGVVNQKRQSLDYPEDASDAELGAYMKSCEDAWDD